MAKKAQGLSLNTMVIAAVVLIVLLILVGIFTGYFGSFVPSLKAAGEQTCDKTGYEGADSCDPDTQRQLYGNFPDLDPGQVCCKSVICEELGGSCVFKAPGEKCGTTEIRDGTEYCERTGEVLGKTGVCCA